MVGIYHLADKQFADWHTRKIGGYATNGKIYRLRFRGAHLFLYPTYCQSILLVKSPYFRLSYFLIF
jgi:hypothetical protein